MRPSLSVVITTVKIPILVGFQKRLWRRQGLDMRATQTMLLYLLKIFQTIRSQLFSGRTSMAIKMYGFCLVSCQIVRIKLSH